MDDKYIIAHNGLQTISRGLTITVGAPVAWEVDAFGDGEIIIRTNHGVGIVRRFLMWVVLGSKWRYLGEGER